MKLKAIFLLFNSVLVVSFLLIFLMPLFLLGTDSFSLFWGRNWIIAVVFVATLGAVNAYFGLNWRLFVNLEKEDWPALVVQLEQKVLRRGLTRPMYIRLLLNAYLILSNTEGILALIIGDYLKAPPHRLIELGNACLLHEIGMLKLPGELRRTPKKLSDDERKVITTHTVLGYRLLKSASAPENVALAAIEHHERMDGSGYPRNLPGDKITEYARIIAVACSYDAIVSRRPFRTSSLDGHSAIKDLLQKNRKQYDDRVLKALVYTLSVYPVGTAVLLSNQGRGIVVKTDPEKPRCPVVKVLRDGDGNKLASPPLVQIAESTEEKGVSITGVLSAEEAAELKGSE
jgi:hypothetical protein